MENNDLFSEMANDVANKKEELKTKVANEKLGTVSNLLKEMTELKKKMDDLNEEYEKYEKRHLDISMKLIPEIFDELGIETIRLNDGNLVEVMTEWIGNIKKDNEPAAFNWLKKHKFDGLINHEINTKLKKGDGKIYAKLIKSLKTLKVGYSDKRSIHHATLKAFLKEQMTGPNAKDFPQDLFSVFKLRKTKVTSK